MRVNSIARDLVAAVRSEGEGRSIPSIRAIHLLAPADEDVSRNSNFGFIVLEDGTVGLTYVAMDDARAGIETVLEKTSFRGRSVLDVAQLYVERESWKRALGLAAVNAASQFHLRRAGWVLPEVGRTVDLLDLGPGDHVGMVGYFPPLVAQIGDRGIALTVVELDEQWLRHEENLLVTLDPGRLADSNKVICTGTTLVNQTLESVLGHCTAAEAFCLVGPTAGCLPGPLFKRGVSLLCGCQVTDTARFIELWRSGQRWREATRRYVIAAGRHAAGQPNRAGDAV